MMATTCLSFIHPGQPNRVMTLISTEPLGENAAYRETVRATSGWESVPDLTVTPLTPEGVAALGLPTNDGKHYSECQVWVTPLEANESDDWRTYLFAVAPSPTAEPVAVVALNDLYEVEACYSLPTTVEGALIY